jgi:hypothetical protein
MTFMFMTRPSTSLIYPHLHEYILLDCLLAVMQVNSFIVWARSLCPIYLDNRNICTLVLLRNNGEEIKGGGVM